MCLRGIGTDGGGVYKIYYICCVYAMAMAMVAVVENRTFK